jgi:hypothetical protein
MNEDYEKAHISVVSIKLMNIKIDNFMIFYYFLFIKVCNSISLFD